MNHETAILLQTLADKYETKSFISGDPVSFPHRYKEKKDIEISASVAQWLAYGRREMFLKILDMLGKDMQPTPYLYIKNKGFEKYKGSNTNLYRFYTQADYYDLCSALHNIYFVEGNGTLSMEDVLINRLGKQECDDFTLLLNTLAAMFAGINGIPCDTKSACKRLCMFLRWMIRKHSPVDFGIWNVMHPKHLIIPLDTHVYQQSKRLGITQRNNVTFKTAVEITQAMQNIFPDDPVRADFALFGYGVNEKINK